MNITIEEVKELMEKRKAEREKRIAQINSILNQEQESEIDALCKIFGFDRNAIETSSKEYSRNIKQTRLILFIQKSSRLKEN